MKFLKLMLVTVFGMCVLSGCEWDSSSDGNSTWDSSSAWVNFSGMYKQSGGGLIVTGYPTGSSSSSNTSSSSSTSVSGTTGTSTQTIGTGGSNNRAFSGTLSTRPILPSSVSVSDGVELLRDDGAGALTSARSGNGTVNYSSGAISVIFELPPVVGAPVVVTYSWSTTNASGSTTTVTTGGGNRQDATASDQPIYSFFVSQQGNKLYIRDSNGVEYHGELGSVANTGGETTGMTSGYIIAQFTAVDADGNKLLGTFQGDYIAPEVPTNPTQTTPSGLLANRKMQGTYMHHDGVHNGDINAIATDDIEITVNPYNPNTNGTNVTAN